MDDELVEAIARKVGDTFVDFSTDTPLEQWRHIVEILRAAGFDVYRRDQARNVWVCEDEDEMAECVDEDDRQDRRAVHGGHRYCGWRSNLGPVVVSDAS